MENRKMYFAIHRVKVYKDLYRPSSAIPGFFRNLFSIIITGKSLVLKPALNKSAKTNI